MSRIIKKLQMLKNPLKLIQPLGARGWFNWMPDRLYLKLIYRAKKGEKLNLESPRLFTEKLQWLKMNNRKSEFTMYADKYEVRTHIKNTLGSQYLIPLIAVYNNIEEIDWESLPNKFVIKCNHGSGTNIICKDKRNLDVEVAKNNLKIWMKKNWYWFGREWPYKNMKKKIIVEELLQDEKGGIPNDYKFWVFNGKVKFINVHFQKNNEPIINIYNCDWELQDFGMVYKNELDVIHEKPININRMIDYAEKLARNLPFVRIDFYEVNSQIYFGEITFYPTSGLIEFHPNDKELDEMYGNFVHL